MLLILVQMETTFKNVEVLVQDADTVFDMKRRTLNYPNDEIERSLILTPGALTVMNSLLWGVWSLKINLKMLIIVLNVGEVTRSRSC